MHESRGARPGRLVRSAVAVAAVALALPAGAQAAGAKTYIVQLKDAPLASYTGGVKGIRGTSPKVTGRKLKVDSANGLDYRAFLASRQKAVLDLLSGARPAVIDSYRNAFAGFAAKLTADQADQLRKSPGVANVFEDELLQPATDDSDERLGGPFGDGAAYLRLTDPVVGLWNTLGGPAAADGAGSGVIVGVVDTGIQPGHPSFADTPEDGYIGDEFQAPEVWDGACQAGTGFRTSDCNNKLIGARYFVDGFGRNNLDPESFLSPRDDDGHGTHTASTAAGNYGVDPVIDGNDLGVDLISGISPRSYVAAYKVCWNGNLVTSPAGCSSVDSVAAIDQAVADGVDVINFSVGSNSSRVLDANGAAFLGAFDAGVFVANSAGNAGPGASTVGSPASVPWLTTVGADTLHRAFTSRVTVTRPDEPFSVKGASVTNELPDSPLADAANSARAGVPAANAELCMDNTLDPAKVAGKVVLCLRGNNARINKSHNVMRAGGVGMILYNASDAQDLDTDTHWVPSAHVNNTNGRRIKDAIARGDASASLTAGSADSDNQEKVVAAFSSRGPQTAVPDIAKPDVVAPGVQILAGAADRPAPTTELRPGQVFQAIQGTSMASPHVAGAGALLTQAHPTLSPAEIKSQLMETANPNVVKENGVTPATVFDQGSGEIDPNKAANSGLVLDATTDDYLSYLEFVDPSIVSGDIPKLRSSDLNLASISFSKVAGSDTTTRVFKSIDSSATRWTISFEAIPGVRAELVSPEQFFTIKPGQTQAVTVKLTNVSAPLDAYVQGALVLTSGARKVRIPISVNPVALAPPTKLSVSTGTAGGSQDITLKTGYTGSLSGLGWGLATPDIQAGKRISATTGNPNPSGTDPGTQLYPVTVPAGSQLISTRLSNVDGGDPNTDLDLFLYRDPNGDGNFSDGVLVAASAGGDSNESISVPFPATAGKYAVAVVGFATRTGGSVYDLSTWVVSDTTPDDASGGPGITVTGDPVSVTNGGTATLHLNWANVADNGTYMGLVTYHQSATPNTGDIAAFSLVELTRTGAATPSPAPAPASGGSGSGTATQGGAVAPGVGSLPGAAGRGGSARAALKLAIRSASVRGRTLTLRLRSGQAASVRASVKRGARFVARATGRRVEASTKTATLRLRLSRALRPGIYTVKVIATDGASQFVQRVTLRVA